MNKKLTTSLVASLLIATNLYSQEALEEIKVVSATKSQQSIKDITSNIDVITKEEIEERNYTSVSEALNTLAGVNVLSNGGLGTQTSVFLRGMTSGRVLVLIDGIKVNDLTSSSGAQFEHLMISDIEKIEVIKGAQSGVWGADASAGVINIITSKAVGTRIEVNVEGGSFNTQKYGIGLAHGTEKFYVKASAKKLDTDGFTAKATRGQDIDDFEDDGYENLTANIKFGYKFNENNKIDLSHTLIDAESEFDGSNKPGDDTHSKTKDKFSSVNFENKNSLGIVNIYATKSTYHREYPSYNSEYDGTVKEYGIKNNTSYLNDSSFFVIGADYKSFEHKNSINKDYDGKSLFVTNNNKFNNDMTILTQSLRYDRYSDFNNKTTGKVGVKHYFTEDLAFSSNYGTAYNIPLLTQMYGRYGANPNLKPESTKSFDVSFEYKAVKTTYFDTKVEDMIAWSGGYNNINGETKLKGIEVSYKEKLSEDLLTTLNYTYLDARNDNDEFLRRRAQNQVSFAFDYYGFEQVHLNLNGKYVGAMYNSDNKTGDKTGAYTVLNTVANFDLSKNFKVYIKMDNITNKYYQNISGYATSPRAAYVGIKAKF